MAAYRSLVALPRIILLKKTDFCSPSNHQLSIALLLGVNFESTVPLHSLAWPLLALMYAVTIVMSSCAAALLYLGNTISSLFSTTSDSYILSTSPPFPVIPEPWEEGLVQGLTFQNPLFFTSSLVVGHPVDCHLLQIEASMMRVERRLIYGGTESLFNTMSL